MLAPVALAIAVFFPTSAPAAPWRATEHNSYGWRLMTPGERIEHQRRLRSIDTYEECEAYLAEHHAQIAQRARQRGTAPTPAESSACEQLRAKGRLK